MSEATCHLPAGAVIIGTERRQVCSWCGELLESLALLRTYTSDGSDDIPTYGTDSWYRFDGNWQYVAAPADEPPEDACCRTGGNDA